MRKITTYEQLIRWTDEHAGARDLYHVKFDLPLPDGESDTTRHTTDDTTLTGVRHTTRAKMILFDHCGPVAEINCFSWKETYLIRKETKFGNNHAYQQIEWPKMRNVLKKVAKHFDQMNIFADPN